MLPRDKAIISALSGPNQANQPPTASPPPPSPTSSRTPALSSPSSSFAPCAFAPTPCMQANPLPLRLPKEAAASVHPRRAPTSNSLSLPCIFRQGNRNFPLTGLPHGLLETRASGTVTSYRFEKRRIEKYNCRVLRWNAREDGILDKFSTRSKLYRTKIYTCVFFGTMASR